MRFSACLFAGVTTNGLVGRSGGERATQENEIETGQKQRQPQNSTEGVFSLSKGRVHFQKGYVYFCFREGGEAVSLESGGVMITERAATINTKKGISY